MCGIAGFYRLAENSDSYPEKITGMLSYIEHRGPDEMGYYFDNKVAIGTARLSIIDIAHGQQPFSDPQGRFWLTFNGEIYNYREIRRDLEDKFISFATNSDTEVLLHAWIHWGESCLQRLNGAFAFAVYDRWQQTLTLVRDRFGKRPLFYYHENEQVYFASEMKCFLAIPDIEFALDADQLASIFRIWTPLAWQTGFKKIRQVPPGMLLKFSNGGVEQKTYYFLDLGKDEEKLSLDEAKQQIRSSLTQSISLRMRSDVEVGTYLSGGLDSAIITSVVAELSDRPVSTFSIGFEDNQFDESQDQNELAEYFGTRHHHCMIHDSDIAEHFPAAVWHGEVPCFRTAFVPMYLLSRSVRDAGIKVVLTGEGADEVFLGYDIFKETIIRQLWKDTDNEQRKSLMRKLYPYLPHFKEENTSSLVSMFDRLGKSRDKNLFSHEMRFQNGLFSQRLASSDVDGLDAINSWIVDNPNFSDLSAMEKAQWLEFQTLLSGYLLSTQGDRMSLAHSVENRCPFLDVNVVSMARRLNLRYDDGFNEKMILKEAFANQLPASVVSKHKHPFRAPDAKVFLENRPDYLELLLSDSELSGLEGINSGFARLFLNRIFSQNAQKISQKENQTFIFLLSTAVLNHQFVKRSGVQVKQIDYMVKVAIDGRKTFGGVQEKHLARSY